MFPATGLCLLLVSQVVLPQQISAPLQPAASQLQPVPSQPQASNAGNSGRELKSVVVATHEEPASQTPSNATALAPIESQADRTAAAQLIQQSVAAPQENGLSGRPYTLLELLRSSPDRGQQLFMTRAYWNLATAIGGYHFALDELQKIQAVVPSSSPADAALLEIAMAAATARLHEAEISAIAAQQELSDLLHLPSGEPLPLTMDVPHVGQYRTYFETLFAAQTPPARTRLIDRVLPVRLELIETRAAAVEAAEKAIAATQAAYAQGQLEMRSVLAAHDALWRERRSFLAAVREYNHEIAEYAMTVAQIGTNEVILVSMLIKSPQMSGSIGVQQPTPAISTPERADGRWVPTQGSLQPAVNLNGLGPQLAPTPAGPAQPSEEISTTPTSPILKRPVAGGT